MSEEIAGTPVEVVDELGGIGVTDGLVVLKASRIRLQPAALHQLVLGHLRTVEKAVHGFVPVMVPKLPPGGTYSAFAEEAAHRENSVDLSDLVSAGPVALLRPGTRYRVEGGDIIVDDLILARVPGSVALDPRHVEAEWGDATRRASPPFQRSPLVLVVSMQPAEQRTQWLERIVGDARDGGVDVRIALSESAREAARGPDPSVAPCRATRASIENLRPAVILALDEDAVSLAEQATKSWRRTGIVRYEDDARGVQILTRTADREDRLLATLGPNVTGEELVPLLIRFAAGPHLRGPRITPTDVRPGRRVEHPHRDEGTGETVLMHPVGLLVGVPDAVGTSARLDPLRKAIEKVGGSVQECALGSDDIGDVPALIVHGVPASADVAQLLESRQHQGHVTFLDLFGIDMTRDDPGSMWGGWLGLRGSWAGLAPTRLAWDMAHRAGLPSSRLPVLLEESKVRQASRPIDLSIVVSPWASLEDVEELRVSLDGAAGELVRDLTVRVFDTPVRWGTENVDPRGNGIPSFREVASSRAVLVLGPPDEAFATDPVVHVTWLRAAAMRVPTMLLGAGAPLVFTDGRDAFLSDGPLTEDLDRVLFDQRAREEVVADASSRVRTLADARSGQTYIRRLLSPGVWRG